MSSAGKFKITVSDPYPVWITLEHECGGQLLKFPHTELSDLRYAVDKAVQEARLSLRRLDKMSGSSSEDEI